jgi:hypothetical protein
VVAVILEPCQWTNIPIDEGGRLGDFLALPRDGRPVTEWPNQNAALNNIVAGIRQLMAGQSASGTVARHGSRNDRSSSVNAPSQRGADNMVANARKGTPSLRLPRQFTDLDRDTFVDDAFESIALAFKERLAALEEGNEGVKVRFQRIDAHCFTACVYVHGKMVGGARVFRGGMSHYDHSINLSYDLSTARNGWNEWLSIEHDAERIYFKAGTMALLTGMGDAQKRKLNVEEAADYLWSVMMSQVQAHFR